MTSIDNEATMAAIQMTGNIKFRPLKARDWEAVSKIYRQGIETGIATFEQAVPDWKGWNKSHMKSCRLIAEVDNEIAGWGALTAVSSRCVYAGVAEVSVYVSKDHRGQKIGSKLLEQLIQASEKEGIWTLEAGIIPENKSSIKIHEVLGFRKIGYREKIGRLNGKWQDTVLYERRSKIVGKD
ncbi:MAG: N-acetyltransferase family protein [Balneolaceae bacterium]